MLPRLIYANPQAARGFSSVRLHFESGDGVEEFLDNATLAQ
jgi:hypothetical protein